MLSVGAIKLSPHANPHARMAEERAKLAEEVLTLAVRAAPKWEANSCQLDVLFTLALVALSLGPGGVKGAVERLMGSKLQTLSRAEAGFSDRFLAELLDRSESQQDSNAPLSRLRKLFSSCQPEFTFADIAHAPGVGDIVRELCGVDRPGNPEEEPCGSCLLFGLVLRVSDRCSSCGKGQSYFSVLPELDLVSGLHSTPFSRVEIKAKDLFETYSKVGMDRLENAVDVRLATLGVGVPDDTTFRVRTGNTSICECGSPLYRSAIVHHYPDLLLIRLSCPGVRCAALQQAFGRPNRRPTVLIHQQAYQVSGLILGNGIHFWAICLELGKAGATYDDFKPRDWNEPRKHGEDGSNTVFLLLRKKRACEAETPPPRQENPTLVSHIQRLWKMHLEEDSRTPPTLQAPALAPISSTHAGPMDAFVSRSSGSKKKKKKAKPRSTPSLEDAPEPDRFSQMADSDRETGASRSSSSSSSPPPARGRSALPRRPRAARRATSSSNSSPSPRGDHRPNSAHARCAEQADQVLGEKEKKNKKTSRRARSRARADPSPGPGPGSMRRSRSHAPPSSTGRERRAPQHRRP
jgi:hypothetical protein